MPPVADRSNVSESEQDGFSDKTLTLHSHIRLRFWDKQKHQQQHRADGGGWHRQAKSHGHDWDRA